ncbi:FtsW/RodA/SpoVE family cell cycle protein [Terribacillus sp. DMT04]|uniref:FtsW/RodA/SpoVE family cell cycle protein n=1 Tax=Terribacillus sp. DMT04 TaxID=2850441 RepID=UPI001C2C54DB|nr:FtsW/RodA/SpoVE family cell cycle protein [Terribacillus sp. DMT04]QXE01651.1 FtsW/RodA/SpoVE family cell cycle protein [Terribacillus sp. DMT04]
MQRLQSYFEKFDYIYFSLIVLLGLTSLVSLYQVQILQGEYFVVQQIVWYVVGLGGCFVVSFFLDLDIIKRLSLFIYLFFLLLLIGILVAPASISTKINEAYGWYSIGGFSFQPAESMKIGLILYLAQVISKGTEVPPTLKEEMLLVGKLTLITLIPVGVVMQFPDFGNAMVYLAIYGVMLIVSRVRMKTILLIFSIPITVVLALAITYFAAPDFFFDRILGMLPSYQASRFYGWLQPEKYAISGYQLNQSIMAIGAGNMGGYEQLPHVPYAYSDLIFAVIGGVFGFLGTSIVLLLYFTLIYKIIMISQRYHDSFGSLIGAGIAGFLTFQIFQNVGMSIGLMPVTGLGLPLISYGGSALVITLASLGLILNMRVNTMTFMFGSK